MTVSLIHPARRESITDAELLEAIQAANGTATSDHRASYARWGDDRELGAWAQLPISEHRESETLDTSNRIVILEDIFDVLGDAKDDDYVRESSSHWAVGWVAIHLVRVFDEDGRITPAAQACANWVRSLRDYPVADETHFCELEHAELDEWLQSDGQSMIENADEPVTLNDVLPDGWLNDVISAAWYAEDSTDEAPYNLDDLGRDHEQALADAAVRLGFAKYDE